jgi:oxygen-independent coproporphyrinogen-3 oxidase
MPALGLYIHVPFCSRICHYCNFNRGVLDDALKARYVAAVRAHISRVGADVVAGGRAAADTISLGGGTPSLLSPTEIVAILDACRAAFDVSADAEITMEANPETVSPATLEGYRCAGVNRLSLGVQSFRDAELRRLGRIHDAARARHAVADARRAGFDNLSLDLMMWLPGQTLAQWRESVMALIDLAPEHASLYMLEMYPHAPLVDAMARAGLSQAPDDTAADMYELAMALTASAGLRQYEISNLARPGRESRHNLKYWIDGEWLGFGPGAHSTWRGARWQTIAATEAYVAAIESGADVERDRRAMTRQQHAEEAIIMGLRLVDGIAPASILEKFGLDLWARYGDHLQPYLDAELVQHDAGRLRLSRKGMLLANEVFAVFI